MLDKTRDAIYAVARAADATATEFKQDLRDNLRDPLTTTIVELHATGWESFAHHLREEARH